MDAFALSPALEAAQKIQAFRNVKYDQERQQRTCSGLTPVQRMTLPGAEGLTFCAGAGVERARRRLYVLTLPELDGPWVIVKIKNVDVKSQT